MKKREYPGFQAHGEKEHCLTMLNAPHHGTKELSVWSRLHDGLGKIRTHSIPLGALPHHVRLLHNQRSQPPLRLGIHTSRETDVTSTIQLLAWERDASPVIIAANSHVNPQGGIPEHSVSPSIPLSLSTLALLFEFCPLPQRPSQPLLQFVFLVLPRRQSCSHKHIASWSVRIETLMRGFQADIILHSPSLFVWFPKLLLLRKHQRGLHSRKFVSPQICHVSLIHWFTLLDSHVKYIPALCSENGIECTL